MQAGRLTSRQAGRLTSRQAGRQVGRQAGRQEGRQAGRQAGGQADTTVTLTIPSYFSYALEQGSENALGKKKEKKVPIKKSIPQKSQIFKMIFSIFFSCKTECHPS
jgi:hypothetical protein